MRFETDYDGRLVSVDIKASTDVFRIISVYLPNYPSDRKVFLENIDRFIFTTSPIIIGGDWNFVENLRLDKFGGNPNKGNEGKNIIQNIKSSYNLIDPFRNLYKSRKESQYLPKIRL